jgi:hypothetical protein
LSALKNARRGAGNPSGQDSEIDLGLYVPFILERTSGVLPKKLRGSFESVLLLRGEYGY